MDMLPKHVRLAQLPQETHDLVAALARHHPLVSTAAGAVPEHVLQADVIARAVALGLVQLTAAPSLLAAPFGSLLIPQPAAPSP